MKTLPACSLTVRCNKEMQEGRVLAAACACTSVCLHSGPRNVSGCECNTPSHSLCLYHCQSIVVPLLATLVAAPHNRGSMLCTWVLCRTVYACGFPLFPSLGIMCLPEQLTYSAIIRSFAFSFGVSGPLLPHATPQLTSLCCCSSSTSSSSSSCCTACCVASRCSNQPASSAASSSCRADSGARLHQCCCN